jgi:signal transduction histidine kinase/ActR/RegA family two-component response regulator
VNPEKTSDKLVRSQRKYRFSIRSILLFALLVPILTVSIAISYLSYHNSSKSVRSLVDKSMKDVDSRIQEQIRAYFRPPVEIDRIVENLFVNGIIDHKDQNKLINQFKTLVKNRESVNSIYFGNTKGGLANAGRDKKTGEYYIIYTDQFEKGPFNKYRLDENDHISELLVRVPFFDGTQRPWYQSALESNDVVWSDAYLMTTGDDLGVTASKAVRNSHNELLGVVGVDLFLSDISNFLADIKVAGSTFIIEDSGFLVASSENCRLFTVNDKNKIGARLNALDSDCEKIKKITSEVKHQYPDFKSIDQNVVLQFKDKGEKSIIHVTPFKVTQEHSWLIITSVPEKLFMAEIIKNNRINNIYIFTAMLLSIILALILAKLISNPILLLASKIMNISKGEWQSQRIPSFIKEIDDLAVGIYEMKVTIQSIIEELKSEIVIRQKTEDELLHAKEKAEESNRLKTNFLANMSHELRTPLSGILGFSELLSATCNEPANHEMVSMISQSGDRLLKTLNLILDLSRVEANNQEIELKTIDLNEHILQAVRLFQPVAFQKNLELSFEPADSIRFIKSDPNMIEHITYELVNNAIKYSNTGRILITAKLKSDFYVLIQVQDSGIGIPIDKQDIIFDAFRQVSEGWNRTFDGPGLGLTICKKYANLLGGDISVESSPEKGSIFTVTLPYVAITPSSESEAIDKNRDSSLSAENKLVSERNVLPNVLLVDDDEVCHQLVRHMLLDIVQLDYAPSAEEGIKLMIDKAYDIVFLDINLKAELGGLGIIDEIKHFDNYRDIPVVAITAYAMLGDRNNFLSHGFSDYLSKPFTGNQLRAIVRKWLSNPDNL